MTSTLFIWPRRADIRRFLGSFVLGLAWLIGTAAEAQTPLNLPFFDDFSTASGRLGLDQPDPSRWQPGSGVYINNTLAVNQPTVNVASFDGLRANGLPYTQNNQFSQGYTDTLASRPINLAGLTAADSVYLSFYWQIRGLGEAPDPGDSLTLQFLDRTGAWQTVWRVEGGAPNNNFPQVFIPLRNTNYFHAGFAFRFRSYGRESGPFDTWNLDYIYLNKGRRLNDRFVKDVAVRQALSPLLKRYTAMPLSQYLVNPAAETADSVTTEIVNLFNNFNFTTFRFTVRDEVSGRLVQDSPQNSSVLIQSLSSQRKSVQPAPVSGFGTGARAVLRYKFDLLTTDDQNPSIPGVNLRQNDTVSAQAVLDDYYAYDDGTWEFGLQIGQRERVAVRFVLNKPDVVAGVRASIVPFRTNQSGQPFVITVYSNTRGRPGNAIYQKSFATQYPTTRNGFVTFLFDRGVSVTDTFYVGYQQVSASDTTLLRLGFDKNSPFGRQIFYNGGSNWDQNQSSPALNLQGAFMLRPIMGGQVSGVVTATPEPEALASLQVYPNPTTGLIRWENPRLSRLEVIAPSGRLVQTLEPSRGQQTLDLSYLPDGLYLLRLFERERAVVQKIIIQH
ncbi:T9SS type A sorting domain-containing protein [Spirosoma taeanense]|uniref:T9SS type A sorting domain-containing protein n=1 Tax=Spirosoma taeanense TaxID=2735870 RepID=A0A6M5Y6Y3_9BACT|nr:T9SS type A sorting domain-containing protein [Spirosoma taeanense]QJW88833.1 T9SS type A sorting domain-containing protein [Spirosoma taeanense]